MAKPFGIRRAAAQISIRRRIAQGFGNTAISADLRRRGLSFPAKSLNRDLRRLRAEFEAKGLASVLKPGERVQRRMFRRRPSALREKFTYRVNIAFLPPGKRKRVQQAFNVTSNTILQRDQIESLAKRNIKRYEDEFVDPEKITFELDSAFDNVPLE